MNNISEKNRKFNFRKLILVLAIASLSFCGLSVVISFFNYKWTQRIENYVLYNSYELVFSAPKFSAFFEAFISLAAAILLFIYVLKLYSQKKCKALFTVVLCIVGLELFVTAIISCLSGNAISHFLYHKAINMVIDIVYLALGVLGVLFILLAVSWNSGKINRRLITVELVGVIAICVFSILEFFVNIGVHVSYNQYFYIFKDLVNLFGGACLYLTSILFLFFNGVTNSNAKAPILSVEDELLLLNEKLELGIITFDEYQQIRSDIIRRL